MPGTSAGVTKSWITRKGGAPQQAQGSNQASRPIGGVTGKGSTSMPDLVETRSTGAVTTGERLRLRFGFHKQVSSVKALRVGQGQAKHHMRGMFTLLSKS